MIYRIRKFIQRTGIK